MSAAYRHALATLRQAIEMLRDPALTADSREAVLADLADAIEVLPADHRLSTAELARRVQKIDRANAHRSARERNEIIRQRLGIRSRTYINELRKCSVHSER